MNAKRFIQLFVLFILLLAATLTGCTAPVSQIIKTIEVEKEAAALQAAGPAPTPAPVTQGVDAQFTQAGLGNTQLIHAPVAQRMVIKDASLQLLVRDADNILVEITQLTVDYGGYILSSNSWYDQGYKYAEIKVAIPSTNFEEALNELRRLGLQLLSETASGQDVSAEYVDLQSQLTNLEATAARVREFLQAAQSVDEALRISQELSNLEAQIEQVKGQMRFYEGRSAYSTVNVRLNPEFPPPTPTASPTPTPTPMPTPGWDPGQTFQQAAQITVSMGRSTVDVLIWLVVVAGPIALVVGLLGFVVKRLIHWLR